MLLDFYRLAHLLGHFFVAHARAQAPATLAHRLWRFTRHLGGPGLVLLGIIDNSIIPVTGSMDALTIILSAHQHALWPYYALMATAGSVLGGYLTYRLGRKGGEKGLETRLSRRRMRWTHRVFEKWGFSSIVVAVILPPPFPVVPFLLAAGATRYATKKFLGALSIGRAVRYIALACLGTIYGNQIISLLRQRGYQILFVYIGFLIAIISFMVVRHYRSKALNGRNPRKSATPARAS